MTSPAPPESDPSAAFRSLFSSLNPHVKTLALVALFSNPFGVLSTISGFPFSLTTTAALIGAASFFGGTSRPASPSSEGAKVDVRQGQAGTDPLGFYLKTGILGYFILQTSRNYAIEFPLPPNIAPGAPWVLFAVAAVGVLFSPTTRLYGPIRFACLESSRAVFPGLSESEWWRYAALLLASRPLLLPVAVAGLGGPGSLSVSIIVCTFVYHTYNAQLRAVAEDVGRHVAVANLALASTREYTATATRFEEHLLTKALTQDKFSATHTYASKALQRDHGVKTADSETSVSSPGAIFAVALAAEDAARLAGKAVSAARNGDMLEARQHAAATKTAADGIVSSMEKAHQEMKQVKDLLRTFLGSQNA